MAGVVCMFHTSQGWSFHTGKGHTRFVVTLINCHYGCCKSRLRRLRKLLMGAFKKKKNFNLMDYWTWWFKVRSVHVFIIIMVAIQIWFFIFIFYCHGALYRWQRNKLPLLQNLSITTLRNTFTYTWLIWRGTRTTNQTGTETIDRHSKNITEQNVKLLYNYASESILFLHVLI